MNNDFITVFQFKITLNKIEPKIWRVIQVPETFNFKQLHHAVQRAMGWEDYHLHQFIIKDPARGIKVQIGVRDNSGFTNSVLAESKQKISDYFSKVNSRAIYVYDFGDEWEHTIKFEKSLPSDINVKYPVCLSGERACPPEDCGGPWGYERLLYALKNKDSEEYDELADYIGDDDYDPEYFNKDEVNFSH